MKIAKIEVVGPLQIARSRAIEHAREELRLVGLRPLPTPMALSTRLSEAQRRGAVRAMMTVNIHGIEALMDVCGMVRSVKNRSLCTHPAGWRTDHEGDGPCAKHEKATRMSEVRAAELAWVMAHKFALEYDVTPWDALLKAVRIAAGKVAYTELVLSQATHDLELEGRFGKTDSGFLIHPDTGEPLGAGQLRDLSWWVQKNEYWVERMARYAKMAVDSGIAERMIEIEEKHAEQVANVLNGVIMSLESSGFDDDTTAQIRSLIREQLLAIEAPQKGSGNDPLVVDGTLV